MSMRKYVKWTPKLRRWVIRETLIKKRSISDLSRSRKLSRSTIYELIKRYFKKGGLEGLEHLPRGRKPEQADLFAERQIVLAWDQRPVGPHKMWLGLG